MPLVSQIGTKPGNELIYSGIQELSEVEEGRKGNLYFVFFYILIIPAIFFGNLFLAGWLDAEPITFPIFIALDLILVFWVVYPLVARESKLHVQNFKPQLKHYLERQEILTEDEHFLCFFVGKPYSFRVPDWVPTNTGIYSLFVFTNKRLVLIHLSNEVAGVNQFLDSNDGSADSMVSGIHSIDYSNFNVIRLGGLLPPNLLSFTHWRIRIKPSSQAEPFGWFVGVKHLNNGKLLKEIINRIPG